MISVTKAKQTIDQIPKPIKGRPTILIKDKETLIVATIKMKATYALPSTKKILAIQLNNVLEGFNVRNKDSPVK